VKLFLVEVVSTKRFEDHANKIFENRQIYYLFFYFFSFLISNICCSNLFFISSNYIFKGLAFETLGPTYCKESRRFQNQRNSFSRGFPLLFNVETLQAFGALFQIPHYYRKFLHVNKKFYVIMLSIQSTYFLF
jgi:hypothetical protein